MRVWDQERGTIRQFADALASESGALPADDIYQRLLGAIWEGEFERDGRCAVSLPNANASGIRQGPDGTWLPIDNRGNELWGEFPAFTREDLRDALIGRSSKIRPNAVPSFDVLKDKPISTYEDAFRNVYLNCLVIESNVVKELLARLRADGGKEPAVAVASALQSVKPSKRGRRPEAKARASKPEGLFDCAVGRPEGVSYAAQDEQLAREAIAWLGQQPPGTSVAKAAHHFSDGILGSGNIESREKRLTRRIRALQSAS